MTTNSLITVVKPKSREWPKQLAAWLCIATLLPLVTWYATAAFHPPPDDAEYERAVARYADTEQPKDSPAKEKFLAEKEQLEKQHEEAGKSFYRVMFWVTYPVGILTILLGLAICIQPVGSGFMFGGIAALASGCYSAWDELGRWAHFWSLIIALVLVVIGSFWRFGKLAAADRAEQSRL